MVAARYEEYERRKDVQESSHLMTAWSAAQKLVQLAESDYPMAAAPANGA